MTDPKAFRSLPEAERERMAFARYLDETRQSTHGEGCWNDGPQHYYCALREIARLQSATDLQTLTQRGEQAWRDVPDAGAWVDELRGNGSDEGAAR